MRAKRSSTYLYRVRSSLPGSAAERTPARPHLFFMAVVYTQFSRRAEKSYAFQASD